MKKILVVDDEKDIRDLIKDALVRENFSVITSEGGEDAILLSKKEKPDLILLDIAIPLMDGYTICERIKKDGATKNIPVVFLTGKDLDTDSVIEHCQNLFVAGYISKMSPLKELLETVKEVLKSHAR